MNVSDLIVSLNKLRDHQYLELLSGSMRHRKTARSSLSRLRAPLYDLLALSVLDDVKKWIGNDPSTATLKFLKSIDAEADKLATEDEWLHRWIAGRAHRYVGRYRRAYKRYNRAIEVINELLKKKKDPGDIKYDVHADYAEFLIYMGGPKIALGYLKANLPKDKELGWYAWVRAFAIHQRAFSDRFPFGSVAKNEPGEKATYVASNKLIDDTLNLKKYKLADSERCDIHLLKAANFGAMIRIDPNDATAIKGAADALSFFSSGPGADPVNKKWSWQKERRGRFMKVHRPLSDNGLFGNKNKSRVEAWRDLYEMHFRENLCAAGLPLTAGDTDGEVDLIEDHLDDDDT